MQNKKAIIFGVTGQDGSHLAEFLLDKHEYKVVGIARRTSNSNSLSRIKHLLHLDRFELVEGDVTDSHSLIQIFQTHADVDEVYNLAAQSHVSVSFKQPALTWDITGKGCLNILQSLVDLSMTHVRFYQASSSEMFGKNFDIREEEGLSYSKYQDETTKFMPQSPYAIAKCAAHYMTVLYREAYGMHTNCGILFNHEGPRRGDAFVTRKITMWLGELSKWIEEHSQQTVWFKDDEICIDTGPQYIDYDSFPKLRLGNLDASRDWGYAGDYVEAMWMMLQKTTPGDYVICTGETHTIREFLEEAFKVIGIYNWHDYVVQDPKFYRPAEVDFLRGSNEKAKKELGWHPKHSFQELVEMMVRHDVQQLRAMADG
jgi:GDPmannose 4,6-dehydratase